MTQKPRFFDSTPTIVFSLLSMISAPKTLHYWCQVCKNRAAINHICQCLILQIFGLRFAIANDSKPRILHPAFFHWRQRFRCPKDCILAVSFANIVPRYIIFDNFLYCRCSGSGSRLPITPNQGFLDVTPNLVISLTSTPPKLHYCCQLCRSRTAIHHVWQLVTLQLFGLRLTIKSWN